MPLVECRALATDGYPAGLQLACDLWTVARQTGDGRLSFRAIEEFWDGVRIVGELRQRPFEIEINYATEEIVLLEVTAPKGRFGGRRRREEFLEEITATVEELFNEMESRQPVRRRVITGP